MASRKTQLRKLEIQGQSYDVLWFWCPGCERVDDEGGRHAGMHMLPVNCSPPDRASWTWDGNLEAPTLSPSILSRIPWVDKPDFVCHSFLRNGVFEFLGDCTHQYANQQVPLPDMPEEWL